MFINAEIAHVIQKTKPMKSRLQQENEFGSNVGVHASFIYVKNQNKEKWIFLVKCNIVEHS